MKKIEKLKVLKSSQPLWLILSSAIVLIPISIFLVSQSLSVSNSEYQKYYDKMLELEELEADFEREILKSRYELYSSYDRLVENLDRQRALEEDLSKIPRFVNFKNRQIIEKNLAKKFETLDEKEELSERFKSQNALLKNSLRYLPLLTSQVEFQEKTALKPEVFSSLKATLEGLIRNLLLYNISVDRQLTANINRLNNQLLDIDIKNKVKTEDFPTEKVISHASIILNTKPQVESLTTQLLSSSERPAEDLEKIFKKSYQQAIQRVKVYRVLTVAWFLGLLGLGNYLWWERSSERKEPSLTGIKQRIDEILGEINYIQTDSSSALNSNVSDSRSYISRLEPYEKELEQLAIRVRKTSDYWQTQDSQLQQQIQNLKHQIETAKQEKEKTVTQAKETQLNQQILQLSAALEQVRTQKQTLQMESPPEEPIAHLSLLTKQQRQIVTPSMGERLQTILRRTLKERECQLLDFQSTPELIQLSFFHPPKIQLSQLVLHLKSVASTCLYEEFPDRLQDFQDITEPGDIWSETYFLTISDASANREEVQAQ